MNFLKKWLKEKKFKEQKKTYDILKNIENHILDNNKLTYVFIFKMSYFHITTNANEIKELLEICKKNSNIYIYDYDVFIDYKANVKQLLEEYKCPSWNKKRANRQSDLLSAREELRYKELIEEINKEFPNE